jgi:hypothetical protein
MRAQGISETIVDSTYVDEVVIEVDSTFMLDEVIVRAPRQRRYAVKEGKLVMNVQNDSLLRSLPDVHDIVSRLPGVMAHADGGLSVQGKGTPLIYIDQRVVRDIDELRRLDPKDIVSIDMAGVPGAQYAGDIRTVIRIKTKRQPQEGFSVRARLRTTQSRRFSTNELLEGTYTTDKWEVRLSLYNGRSRSETDGQFDTELYLHDNRRSVEENTLSHPFSLFNIVTANIGYNIHPNHRLHLYYNYNYNKQIWDSQTEQAVRLNEQAYDEVTQQRVTNDRNTTQRANLSYEGKVDKVEMNMNVDYIGKRVKGLQSSQENSTHYEDIVANSHSVSDFDIYAGELRLDYKAGAVGIGGGVNAEHTQRESDFFYVEEILPASRMGMRENKYALFATADYALKRLQMQAGVRYEYQKDHFTDRLNGNTLLDKSYSNFFPNISLSYPVGNVQLTAAAGRRIQRPTYYQLREGTEYVNRFTYDRGNPMLQPQYITTYSLNAFWKGLYADVSYVHNSRYIGINFEEDPALPTAMVSTAVNYKNARSLELTVSYSETFFKFWTPQVSVYYSLPHMKVPYRGAALTLKKPFAYMQFYNTFQAPGGYVFSIDMSGYNSGNSGESYLKSYFACNASVRKAFLKNTLSVSLQGTDIFRAGRERNYHRLGVAYYARNQYRDARGVQLTITYNLQNYKASRTRAMAGDAEMNRTNK